MEYKIFLASRTAYTRGIIDGDWIDLTDANAYEKIEDFMDEREGQEFFIADSMESVPMDIGEYEDPYALVDFVERLENLDETQLEAYEAIMNELGLEREEALDIAENWEFDAIEWDGGSIEVCIGYYYAELNGWLDYDEAIWRYFDYEKYGRDISVKHDVCENGKTIFVIHN